MSLGNGLGERDHAEDTLGHAFGLERNLLRLGALHEPKQEGEKRAIPVAEILGNYENLAGPGFKQPVRQIGKVGEGRVDMPIP